MSIAILCLYFDGLNMLEALLATAGNGLILAMDFEEASSWVDLVKPSRKFSIYGDTSSLTRPTTQKINGAQSLYQVQPASAGGPTLYTPVTSELIFEGDFWWEFWAYTLGQGNPLYTGDYNTLLSYGIARGAPNNCWRLALLGLKFGITVGGTSNSVLVRSTIATTNSAWHHYAVGRSGATTYLFQDGAPVATTTGLTDAVGFGDNLHIANYYDTALGGQGYAGLNGYMDRLRMYKGQCLHTAAFVPETGPYR